MPLAQPAPPAQDESESGTDAENSEDAIQLDLKIVEVASGTDQSKKMIEWIETQRTEQPDKGVPILSRIPYVNRLFKQPRMQLASTASGVAQRQTIISLLSEEKGAQFVEKFLDPNQHTYLSRPTLMTVSGRPGSVVVGQFDPQTKELTSGISLKLRPTLMDGDTVRLGYFITLSKPVASNDVDEQLSKDQSTKDFPKPQSKYTVETCVQFQFDQILVMASQGGNDDAPYDVVIVKCKRHAAKPQ